MINEATPITQGGSDHHTEIEVRIGTEIRNIGIPPRPAILGRIENEMRKDEPDFRMLADIIGSDVGLSASVIKVANSPFFGFGKRVRSIPEALLVLGLKLAVKTIAGIALKKTFPRVPSLDRFWDSAAKTAHLSSWLAMRLKDRIKVRPDDAYTFGLFRDCGIPVLMVPFPEYARVLKSANEEKERIFTIVEDEVYAINHALIGSELAEDWRLPDELTLAIRYHHEPSAVTNLGEKSLPVLSQQLIAISHLAEHLIQKTTGLNQTNEWGKLGSKCLMLLNITDGELSDLERESGDIVKAEL